MGSDADAIKGATPLSQYIMRKTGTVLKGNGGKFRGPCPIHGSTSDSVFSVDDVKGNWRCFKGCGSGSIIDFWMALNDKNPDSPDSFGQALEALSRDLNVPLRQRRDGGAISRSAVSGAIEDVSAAACDALLSGASPEAESALPYLLDRGLTEEVISHWQIGVIPEKGKAIDFIREATDSKGFKALEAAALVEPSKFGSGRMFTSMHTRIIFPIVNESGLYVGLSGRVIPGMGDESKGKYLNSRSSTYFDKSSVMFGADFAGRDRKEKVAVVCEGQMDVIAVWDALGDDYVPLATCGTSLTEQHMKWLAGFREVVLMFDGDEAGSNAVMKAMPIINHCGDRVRVVSLPDGLDPDELVRERGSKALEEAVELMGSPILRASARSMWQKAEEKPDKFLELLPPAMKSLESRMAQERLLSDCSIVSGLKQTHISRELKMNASLNVSGRKQDSSTVVSRSAHPLLSWLSAMDSGTRQGLLYDAESWTEDNFICRELLKLQSATDVAVFKFLALGSNGTTMQDAPLIATMLAESENNDPTQHLLSIAQILLDEMKNGGMKRDSASAIMSIARQSEWSESKRQQAFSTLMDSLSSLI